MNTQPLVTILMATYNGAEYIKEQLDSLVSQSYTNWRLLIRDDGSTDETVNLIKSYTLRYSNISLSANENDCRGAVSNFAALFERARYDERTGYVMFCDQDDSWYPDKIKESLRLMQKTESCFIGEPILVYGNLQMITQAGQEMNQHIALLPQLYFERTLVQNFAYGCTMMLNKPLMELVDKIPLTAANHDHWIALIVSAFGKTAFLTEPLLGYRQHDQNVTSQGNSLRKRIKRFTSGFDGQLQTFKKLMTMLIQFKDDFGEQLSVEHTNTLTAIIKGYHLGRWNLLYQIVKNKTFKLTFLQNVGMIYSLIFFYSHFKEQPADLHYQA